LSLRSAVFEIFDFEYSKNVVTQKSGSKVTHSRWRN